MDKASLLDWCSIARAGEVGNFLSIPRFEGGEGSKVERLKDMARMSREEHKLSVILLTLINSTLTLIQNQ